MRYEKGALGRPDHPEPDALVHLELPGSGPPAVVRWATGDADLEAAFGVRRKVFVDEQDTFRELIGESILPTLEVDVSDDDVPRAVQKIADWMEATGGLYAP